MPTRPMFLALAAAVVVFAGTASAQTVAVPKELSGRWTFAAANRTNLFSLDDIAAAPEGRFTALLTWWTTDPKCTLRKEPITGTVTATGIRFESKTKCDVEFSAVLDAQGADWTGQARVKDNANVVIDMKAR